MTTEIRTKLVVADGQAALEWYAATLDAEIGEVFTDGSAVVHADVLVLGTHLSLKGADEFDPVPLPGVILEVLTDDPDPVEARMLTAGATSVFPVDDQPYGARAGRVRDLFGVQWLLTTPVAHD